MPCSWGLRPPLAGHILTLSAFLSQVPTFGPLLIGETRRYFPHSHSIFSTFPLLPFPLPLPFWVQRHAAVFCLRLPRQGDNLYFCADPTDPWLMLFHGRKWRRGRVGTFSGFSLLHYHKDERLYWYFSLGSLFLIGYSDTAKLSSFQITSPFWWIDFVKGLSIKPFRKTKRADNPNGHLCGVLEDPTGHSRGTLVVCLQDFEGSVDILPEGPGKC